MKLSLDQSRAISELAQALYPFLPGSPHPYADQATSFEGVAERVGVGRHWHGGSKQPAIADLFAGTLEHNPNLFCGLIVEIVRGGFKYRANRDPITREELDHINGLIARVGFKIPELVDATFLRGLPSAASDTVNDADVNAAAARLSTSLLELSRLEPQPRGFAFEKFLNELFRVYRLLPRASFKLTGEQIDGSFELDGFTYLLEAKWQNAPLGQQELLVLSGKVGGKAEWSRGLLVSVSGFTRDGLEAYERGKRANIICMDGLDLNDVLTMHVDLRAAIQRKARRAAETNEAFVRTRDLFELR